jgi:hypothetical protein
LKNYLPSRQPSEKGLRIRNLELLSLKRGKRRQGKSKDKYVATATELRTGTSTIYVQK